MKKSTSLFFILLISLQLVVANVYVRYNDTKITYAGRVDVSADNGTGIYWPGTSIDVKFKGTSVDIVMKNGQEDAYFYAILDQDDSKPVKFKAKTVLDTIQLFSGLTNDTHKLRIFKLSNNTSFTHFYGFIFSDKTQILQPDKLPARKIEFYGNSITAGHGVDVLPGKPDSGSPEYFNNYWTYAARTARHFNARYSCIARSGIGFTVSWFPEIMPEIYDRINPTDTDSKWNFHNYTPDIVVINLGQNDKWLTTRAGHPQFKARFGTTAPTEDFIVQAYKNFVTTIRGRYPQATIICALGSMDATRNDSQWPGYIKKAVTELNDSKIYTLFFPYKNTEGHPKSMEQEAMSKVLIDFIDKNIKW